MSMNWYPYDADLAENNDVEMDGPLTPCEWGAIKICNLTCWCNEGRDYDAMDEPIDYNNLGPAPDPHIQINAFFDDGWCATKRLDEWLQVCLLDAEDSVPDLETNVECLDALIAFSQKLKTAVQEKHDRLKAEWPCKMNTHPQ